MKFFIFLFLFSFSLFAKNNIAYSDYGLSFQPLNNWHKKDNNFYYGMDGSSINIQSEESLLDLTTFVDLMTKKLKKGYHNYIVIKKENEVIDSYKAIVITGKFDFHSKKNNIQMEFYTIVFNLYGEKIIITIAYPKTLSSLNKKKLLNIQKTISFVGAKKKKGTPKEIITLNWYENKSNNYKLLIPSDYKFEKDGLFINENGLLLAIINEDTDVELKEYFKIYINKLKKKYKTLSILEESFERKKGFKVLFVKITTDKIKISNIFYKKENNIYILTLSGENKYIEKIKDSFQNLK